MSDLVPETSAARQQGGFSECVSWAGAAFRAAKFLRLRTQGCNMVGSEAGSEIPTKVAAPGWCLRFQLSQHRPMLQCAECNGTFADGHARCPTCGSRNYFRARSLAEIETPSHDRSSSYVENFKISFLLNWRAILFSLPIILIGSLLLAALLAFPGRPDWFAALGVVVVGIGMLLAVVFWCMPAVIACLLTKRFRGLRIKVSPESDTLSYDNRLRVWFYRSPRDRGRYPCCVVY